MHWRRFSKVPKLHLRGVYCESSIRLILCWKRVVVDSSNQLSIELRRGTRLIFKRKFLIDEQLEHFQCSCNASIVLSHPRRKNKNAPRVGHPNLTLTLKML